MTKLSLYCLKSVARNKIESKNLSTPYPIAINTEYRNYGVLPV